jgi:hypothetical protein
MALYLGAGDYAITHGSRDVRRIEWRAKRSRARMAQLLDMDAPTVIVRAEFDILWRARGMLQCLAEGVAVRMAPMADEES